MSDVRLFTEADLEAELHDGIRKALPNAKGLSAERIAAAAQPLWDELEEMGMVDGFGGCESRRVLPAALAFIRYECNAGPHAPPFVPDYYEPIEETA